MAAAACAGAFAFATFVTPADATNSNHSDLLQAMQYETAAVNDGDATTPAPRGGDAIPGIIARTDVNGDQWSDTAKNPSATTRQVDAKFRAASNSKMFTAVVILQLVEEGRLTLDQDVYFLLGPVLNVSGSNGCDLSNWPIKCFKAPSAGGTPITVRHLLNMSSGIKDYMDDTSFKAKVATTFPNTAMTPQQLVDEGAANGPQFVPGSSFEYSNTNYALLGMIIERVTTHTWQDEINTRIIQPLNLTGTTVPNPGTTALPGPHDPHYSNLLLPRVGSLHASLAAADQDTTYAYGTGGVVSTTADLVTFLKALLQGNALLETNEKNLMLGTLNTTPVGTPRPGGPPAGVTCDPGLAWPECISNPLLYDVTGADPNADTHWYAEQPWTQVESSYGLGITKRELTCSDGTIVPLWGHNGGMPGSLTYTYATDTADHVVSLNYNGDWPKWELYSAYGLLASEFCT